MTVATALISGADASPQLAENAVNEALQKSGLTHANGVLLFLTPEFTRYAQQSVTAAARAAQCVQVAGGIAAGVFTEAGWVLDRPAAAVMVFGGDLSLALPTSADEPVLSYASGAFPSDWASTASGAQRFGGSFSGSVAHADPVVWQQSRLTEHQRCSVQLSGAHTRIGVSSGLRLLSEAQCIEHSSACDLQKLGGDNALANLQRALGHEYNAHATLPLHHLSALLLDDEDCASAASTQAALAKGRYRSIAIIAAQADGSLTLAEGVAPGQHLAWAIRQPDAAENDMRQTLAQLASDTPKPTAALMFSCIGRGPYFYGGEDRDLDILRSRFPGLPLLGAYGTGQIAPMDSAGHHRNRQLQHAAVIALIGQDSRTTHV